MALVGDSTAMPDGQSSTSNERKFYHKYREEKRKVEATIMHLNSDL